MLKHRVQGLVALCALLEVLIVPAWFSLYALCAIEILHFIHYQQINVPLYTLSVLLAMAVSSHRKRQISLGPSRSRWREAARRTNFDIVVLSLVLFGVVFAIKDTEISRLFLGSFLVSAWLLLLFLNRFLHEFISRLVFRDAHLVNTLVVCGKSGSRYFERWIHQAAPLGMNMVGLVTSGEGTAPRTALPVLGGLSDLKRIILEHAINQVIMLEADQSENQIRDTVNICRKNGCRFLIHTRWEQYFDHPLSVISEGGHTFFALQDEPLQNPLNGVAKRLLDLAITLVVVICILPGLCIVVKFMQCLQAPGPLFFKQRRTGYHQRTFNIYKFRTMYAVEGEGGNGENQATRGDRRIYPFGGRLRKTSLDEIPQFINVLLGHMSVVGPRPHFIQHEDQFSEIVNFYRTRSFVKPGITGLAQYKGYRGEITDPAAIHERVRLDVEYIKNWSIWWDIGLILKTLRIVVRPPNSAV